MINGGIKKRLTDKLIRERNIFKLLFIFSYFLGVKNVLHNPSSSQL